MITVNIDETKDEQVIASGLDFYKVNKIPGIDLDAQITIFQSTIDSKNQEIIKITAQMNNLQNVKLLIPPIVNQGLKDIKTK